MKQKLLAFFSGMNGLDTLAKALIFPALTIMFISSFVNIGWLKYTLLLISILIMTFGYIRVFSKDIYSRRKEDLAFREFFKILKLKIKDRHTHRYFRCPDCRAWQRVPKGRGNIKITCRVCKHKFDKTT